MILSEDPDISMILIEEMPAYFLGQKDLDSVIKISWILLKSFGSYSCEGELMRYRE
jgi:hypothetical protein